MKIAVSATGQDLDSSIDERFGRCRYFLIVETDDMSCQAIQNTNAELSSSAGIQSASMVASQGVEAVITGNCGPKAMQVFDSTTIRMILGQQGVVRDAVENYKRGALTPSTRENVPEKSGIAQNAPGQMLRQPGMGSGGGRGMGGGGGRGMGCGGGRGMGMGGGGGRGMGMGRRCQTPGAAVSPGARQPAGNLSRKEELTSLQQQSDELKRQMEAIQAKINSLE